MNRNLGFFTTGYNYLIQIIPALFVAPQFIRGEVEFGVITQSAMAFTQLLGAFSLIINQFGSISSFAAVIARLSGLAEAVDGMTSIGRRSKRSKIVTGSPTSGSRFGRRATTARCWPTCRCRFPRGLRVLVTGPNEAARVALFRATAGIWSRGEGRIVRPPLDAIFFLPQQPYLTPGTLRHLLVRTGQEQEIIR